MSEKQGRSVKNTTIYLYFALTEGKDYIYV